MNLSNLPPTDATVAINVTIELKRGSEFLDRRKFKSVFSYTVRAMQILEARKAEILEPTYKELFWRIAKLEVRAKLGQMREAKERARVST